MLFLLWLNKLCEVGVRERVRTWKESDLLFLVDAEVDLGSNSSPKPDYAGRMIIGSKRSNSSFVHGRTTTTNKTTAFRPNCIQPPRKEKWRRD
jgi:hypothetical protein